MAETGRSKAKSPLSLRTTPPPRPTPPHPRSASCARTSPSRSHSPRPRCPRPSSPCAHLASCSSECSGSKGGCRLESALDHQGRREQEGGAARRATGSAFAQPEQDGGGEREPHRRPCPRAGPRRPFPSCERYGRPDNCHCRYYRAASGLSGSPLSHRQIVAPGHRLLGGMPRSASSSEMRLA